MIVVFDAQCLLCSGWVSFLLRHDRRRVFQFAYRYRVFGRRETCYLPRPEDADRFIE